MEKWDPNDPNRTGGVVFETPANKNTQPSSTPVPPKEGVVALTQYGDETGSVWGGC